MKKDKLIKSTVREETLKIPKGKIHESKRGDSKEMRKKERKDIQKQLLDEESTTSSITGYLANYKQAVSKESNGTPWYLDKKSGLKHSLRESLAYFLLEEEEEKKDENKEKGKKKRSKEEVEKSEEAKKKAPGYRKPLPGDLSKRNLPIPAYWNRKVIGRDPKSGRPIYSRDEVEPGKDPKGKIAKAAYKPVKSDKGKEETHVGMTEPEFEQAGKDIGKMYASFLQPQHRLGLGSARGQAFKSGVLINDATKKLVDDYMTKIDLSAQAVARVLQKTGYINAKQQKILDVDRWIKKVAQKGEKVDYLFFKIPLEVFPNKLKRRIQEFAEQNQTTPFTMRQGKSGESVAHLLSENPPDDLVLSLLKYFLTSRAEIERHQKSLGQAAVEAGGTGEKGVVHGSPEMKGVPGSGLSRSEKDDTSKEDYEMQKSEMGGVANDIDSLFDVPEGDEPSAQEQTEIDDESDVGNEIASGDIYSNEPGESKRSAVEKYREEESAPDIESEDDDEETKREKARFTTSLKVPLLKAKKMVDSTLTHLPQDPFGEYTDPDPRSPLGKEGTEHKDYSDLDWKTFSNVIPPDLKNEILKNLILDPRGYYYPMAINKAVQITKQPREKIEWVLGLLTDTREGGVFRNPKSVSPSELSRNIGREVSPEEYRDFRDLAQQIGKYFDPAHAARLGEERGEIGNVFLNYIKDKFTELENMKEYPNVKSQEQEEFLKRSEAEREARRRPRSRIPGVRSGVGEFPPDKATKSYGGESREVQGFEKSGIPYDIGELNKMIFRQQDLKAAEERKGEHADLERIKNIDKFLYRAGKAMQHLKKKASERYQHDFPTAPQTAEETSDELRSVLSQIAAEKEKMKQAAARKEEYDTLSLRHLEDRRNLLYKAMKYWRDNREDERVRRERMLRGKMNETLNLSRTKKGRRKLHNEVKRTYGFVTEQSIKRYLRDKVFEGEKTGNYSIYEMLMSPENMQKEIEVEKKETPWEKAKPEKKKEFYPKLETFFRGMK